MIRILAIDSASEYCSVALTDGVASYARTHIASRGHGDIILQMIRQLLDETAYAKNTIDLLAFGRGPGAFTSLRVAAGIIQGLAVGLDRPIVGVSSLAALAHGVFRTEGYQRAYVAIDARMNQVYHGTYQTSELGDTQLIGEEQVSDPALVTWLEGHLCKDEWVMVGNGWQVYEDIRVTQQAVRKLGKGVEDSALDVAYIAAKEATQGRAVTAEFALPVYIRDQVAHKKASVMPIV
ncbi:MAG: tRNA (adenosine(37)-N6)-threonylcarbamoyltransferase complex dimerization subunit type 1 TsaB [Gammaproteobacteria bacterium]|nr:tRNA (adenosine(37)-N6)-threonylcarbamoyltransferase complex dimerization subunit type 1 TsaB [Gammaproteobacteria bacterium]